MSEHIWVSDHLAAYVADGLTAAERARVDIHAAECETCAQALAELRSLDTSVENLFAGVRPTPALEDRMIRALRAYRPRKSWSIGLRVAASVAALVALGIIGTIGTGLLAEGTLRFPGTSADEAVAWVDSSRSIPLESFIIMESGGGGSGTGIGGGVGSGSGAGSHVDANHPTPYIFLPGSDTQRFQVGSLVDTKQPAKDDAYKFNKGNQKPGQPVADSARKKLEESLNDATAPSGGSSRGHGASEGRRGTPASPRTPAARNGTPTYGYPMNVPGAATGGKVPRVPAPSTSTPQMHHRPPVPRYQRRRS